LAEHPLIACAGFASTWRILYDRVIASRVSTSREHVYAGESLLASKMDPETPDREEQVSNTTPRTP
jgi:hypothetical protein